MQFLLLPMVGIEPGPPAKQASELSLYTIAFQKHIWGYFFNLLMLEYRWTSLGDLIKVMTDYDWRAKEKKERKSGTQTHDLQISRSVLCPLCHHRCPFPVLSWWNTKKCSSGHRSFDFLSQDICRTDGWKALEQLFTPSSPSDASRGWPSRARASGRPVRWAWSKKFRLAERCRLADTLKSNLFSCQAMRSTSAPIGPWLKVGLTNRHNCRLFLDSFNTLSSLQRCI